MVVEHTKSEWHLFDNQADVRTHASGYDWHLSNVRDFLNHSNGGTSSVQEGLVQIIAIGQDGGMQGRPGD